MARYTGPKWRISRRENADVYGDAQWRKRGNPPGQFPVAKTRPSEYAIQFREKQKVKRMYGVMEKQFVRYYKIATKSTGNTGTRMLQILEMRIDNIVYKLGFAKTRNQARQMVTHGHIQLNGKNHNIPSTMAQPGDEITFKPKFAQTDAFKALKADLKTVVVPTWLNQLAAGGKVVAEPTRDEMDQSIKERLIIEYYSK
jgi:small subunit ribosomal protein S4